MAFLVELITSHWRMTICKNCILWSKFIIVILKEFLWERPCKLSERQAAMESIELWLDQNCHLRFFLFLIITKNSFIVNLSRANFLVFILIYVFQTARMIVAKFRKGRIFRRKFWQVSGVKPINQGNLVRRGLPLLAMRAD